MLFSPRMEPRIITVTVQSVGSGLNGSSSGLRPRAPATELQFPAKADFPFLLETRYLFFWWRRLLIYNFCLKWGASILVTLVKFFCDFRTFRMLFYNEIPFKGTLYLSSFQAHISFASINVRSCQMTSASTVATFDNAIVWQSWIDFAARSL